MKLSPHQQQIAVGAGLGVLGLSAIYFLLRSSQVVAAPSILSTSPFDTGIYVHPSCTDWSVTNNDKFKATLASVFGPLTTAGERNPWALARAMLQRVAPQCPSLGASDVPSNPSEALLVYIFVLDATFALEGQKLVSPEEATSLRAQANAWALSNGVPENKLYV